MDVIRTGFDVFAIDDQRVGTVNRVNACCFEVSTAAGRWALVVDSVFNVVVDRVTLVCNALEVGRYACQLHQRRLHRRTT